jgi:hypothetical protein
VELFLPSSLVGMKHKSSEATHVATGTPKCRTALFEVMDPYVGVENMNGALLNETSLFQDYAEKRPKRPL